MCIRGLISRNLLRQLRLLTLFVSFQSMVTGATGVHGEALEHAVCHAVVVLRVKVEQECVITHPLLARGPHVLDQTRTARV